MSAIEEAFKDSDDPGTSDDAYVPDWVNEGDEDIDVGDLSAVGETDAIDTVRGVTLEIRKAHLDTQEFKVDGGGKVWAKRNLHLQLNVGPEGAGENGEGEPRYVNKAFFVNLLLMINKEEFPDAFKYDKYQATGKAWRPTKQFYRAMGGDPAKVSITRDFRESLVGRSVKADIVKKMKRTQVNGEWVDQGWQNEIENFRSVE